MAATPLSVHCWSRKMEQAIAKAGALIEAMEYIRSFKGKIVVVKLGGSILDDIELTKKTPERCGLYVHRRDAADPRSRRRQSDHGRNE